MDIQWPGKGLDRRIWVWFQLRGKKIFFSPKRTSWLSIAYSPSQLTPYALSPGIKRPGRETDHWPSSSAKLTIARCYTSIIPYAFKTRYLKIPSPVTTARHSFCGHEILYFLRMYLPRSLSGASYEVNEQMPPVRKALYTESHEKVAPLPFCTCPCDILSGVSMYIA